MLPDRLEALRRQRALVAQHLAWLDSEIAASSPSIAPTTLPAPITAPIFPAARASSVESSAPAPVASVTLPIPEPTPEALAVANARADDIIAQHAASDRFDPKSAKRGCILLASAVFLLGLAGAMFAYLLYYNK